MLKQLSTLKCYTQIFFSTPDPARIKSTGQPEIILSFIYRQKNVTVLYRKEDEIAGAVTELIDTHALIILHLFLREIVFKKKEKIMKKILMILALAGFMTGGYINESLAQDPGKTKKTEADGSSKEKKVKDNGTVKEKKVKDNGTVKEKKTKPDGSVKKETKKVDD